MGRERKIGLDRSVEEVVEGRPDGARAAPHARYAQPIAGAFATGEVAALGVVRRYQERTFRYESRLLSVAISMSFLELT